MFTAPGEYRVTLTGAAWKSSEKRPDLTMLDLHATTDTGAPCRGTMFFSDAMTEWQHKRMTQGQKHAMTLHEIGIDLASPVSVDEQCRGKIAIFVVQEERDAPGTFGVAFVNAPPKSLDPEDVAKRLARYGVSAAVPAAPAPANPAAPATAPSAALAADDF